MKRSTRGSRSPSNFCAGEQAHRPLALDRRVALQKAAAEIVARRLRVALIALVGIDVDRVVEIERLGLDVEFALDRADLHPALVLHGDVGRDLVDRHAAALCPAPASRLSR